MSTVLGQKGMPGKPGGVIGLAPTAVIGTVKEQEEDDAPRDNGGHHDRERPTEGETNA